MNHVLKYKFSLTEKVFQWTLIFTLYMHISKEFFDRGFKYQISVDIDINIVNILLDFEIPNTY